MSINKMEKVDEIERFIVDNYLCIPKDDYMSLFNIKASYDFPFIILWYNKFNYNYFKFFIINF